jgi:hypothetical protein
MLLLYVWVEEGFSIYFMLDEDFREALNNFSMEIGVGSSVVKVLYISHNLTI